MRKKGINGRKKGHGFERLIAQQLTVWCGFEMKRSPMSGGWAKTGDVTPVRPEDMVRFPFNFEMKKRENWNFSDLITLSNRKTGIISWWKQCFGDARISKKIPVLVFTRNRDSIYCATTKDIFNKIFHDQKSITSFTYKNLTFFLFDRLIEIDYESLVNRLK